MTSFAQDCDLLVSALFPEVLEAVLFALPGIACASDTLFLRSFHIVDEGVNQWYEYEPKRFVVPRTPLS